MAMGGGDSVFPNPNRVVEDSLVDRFPVGPVVLALGVSTEGKHLGVVDEIFKFSNLDAEVGGNLREPIGIWRATNGD